MKYQETIPVLLLGLLMAAGTGFAYFSGNQHTYLVDGLRIINSEFLQYDWFATQTTHYHNNFGAVLWLINQLMPLSLGTIALNTSLILLSIWTLYQLFKHGEVTRPLPALALLVALTILTRSTSVGSSYIYSSYLQPSSIASVFLLLSFVWFVKRQYWASGLFLLVSGMAHTNFLLLGLATIGLAHLMLGKDDFFKRTAQNMVPACLYLVYLLPGLLAMSTSEFGEQSRYIYQHIRSPHHYIPATYLGDFVKFFGISLLGLAIGRLHLTKESPLKPLVLLFLSMLGIVTIATILTTVVFIPFVSQLFPWRLAPFVELLALVLMAVTVVNLLEKRAKLPRSTNILLFTGTVLVLTYYQDKAKIDYVIAVPVAIIFVAAFVTVMAFLMKRPLAVKLQTPPALNLAILTLLLAALTLRLPVAWQHSNILRELPATKQTLFAWSKNQTAINSQMLIPPGFDDFRLRGERAVVVDWKSPPILPEEVMVWYQRIADVTGIEKITSAKQANAAYANMDAKRLNTLKSKYNIDYAVFYNRNKKLKELGKVVFENNKYLVIEL